MATQEFYIQAGGSFLNAGSTTSNSAAYTSTNGNWSTVTNQFIPTDGSTPASTVSVGDYASIYLDAAAAAVCIARVTTVAAGVNGAITLSTTVRAGTAPTTGTTGRSINVGGAQKIPTTSVLGPMFTMAGLGNLQPTTNDTVRINCKNDATYRVTANSTGQNQPRLVTYQGYTTTVADKGVAFIDGASGGAAFTLWNVGQGVNVYDLDFSHNGTSTSGSGTAGAIFAGSNIVRRCAFHDIRGSGTSHTGNQVFYLECEAYNCNTQNAANEGGFKGGALTSCAYIRCMSHDSAGSNSFGFRIESAWIIQHCVSAHNGGNGIEFFVNNNAPSFISHCDSYNNGGYGIKGLNSGYVLDAIATIQSCNLVKNGNTGVDLLGSTTLGTFNGFIDNNGYGTGTMVNGGSGATDNLGHVLVDSGVGALSVNYPANATPWVDPDNGDFRINLTQANWAGYGYFRQVAGDGYTSRLTVGFPDIGAVQSKTGAGGTFSKETSGGYVS